MKYSRNVDYLIVSIIYLGTHSYFWGRTAKGLAAELGLDDVKLLAVFEGFPGLFRETTRKSDNGQNYFALQARHAQRKGGNTEDPKPNEDITPLSVDKLELLLKFVLAMTEQEKSDRRGWWTGGIAIAAALVLAAAAVFVAVKKGG